MSLAVVYSRIHNKVQEYKKSGLGGWLFDRIGSTKKIYPMKHDDIIRSSGIGNLCPRLETLCARDNIVRDDVIDPMLRWRFDVGTLTHHLYRDWYLGPLGMYRGRWKCLKCGWNTDGDELDKDGMPMKSMNPGPPHPAKRGFRLVRMPELCGRCGAGRDDEDGSKIIVFSEWDLVNHEYGITGHTDGWRFDPDKKEILLQEIKSADQSSFAYTSINGPYYYTKKQISTYMWLTGFKRGEVVYLNKGAKSQSGKNDYDCLIKAHLVEFDFAWFKASVLDKIVDMRKCLKSGVLADRNCTTIDSQSAKWCKYKDLCFSMKE